MNTNTTHTTEAPKGNATANTVNMTHDELIADTERLLASLKRGQFADEMQEQDAADAMD